MPPRLPLVFPTRSPLLLWLAGGGAAAALFTIAVVAWQAANRQRTDGEGALRQTAANVCALAAEGLEMLLREARATPVHAPVKRTWFTRSGDAGDWIFGPWPQPADNDAGAAEQAAAFLREGKPAEARALLQQTLENPAAVSKFTASGLPLRPLLLKLAMSADPDNARSHAAALIQSAASQPSPLSAAFLDEAAAAFTTVGNAPEPGFLSAAREHLRLQDDLRHALRHGRDAVASGAAWAEDAESAWHLSYDAAGDLVTATPLALLSQISDKAGFGREGVEGLPVDWILHASLDERNIQELTYSTGGLMASASRGPLLVEATAFPPEAFASLDAQLIRQRWLIGGATAAMGAALSGVLLLLARQRRLNAMMSNFVASVSHELRAPIGSMGLLVERLGDGRAGDADSLAHYHQLIRGECRRISATIENVLAFSRMERGRRAIDPELSDLSALLRDAADLIRPLAGERQVTVECKLPDQPVELEIDPVAMRQAVLNLLDNALKFSPPGGTIRMRLTKVAGAVTIAIRDEGPGIPPAERERIFQPFYRIGSELRRETPGIGIGLAIVKYVVEAHGGKISAACEGEHGSEFRMELTAKDDDARNDAKT